MTFALRVTFADRPSGPRRFCRMERAPIMELMCIKMLLSILTDMSLSHNTITMMTQRRLTVRTAVLLLLLHWLLSPCCWCGPGLVVEAATARGKGGGSYYYGFDNDDWYDKSSKGGGASKGGSKGGNNRYDNSKGSSKTGKGGGTKRGKGKGGDDIFECES